MVEFLQQLKLCCEEQMLKQSGQMTLKPWSVELYHEPLDPELKNKSTQNIEASVKTTWT